LRCLKQSSSRLQSKTWQQARHDRCGPCLDLQRQQQRHPLHWPILILEETHWGAWQHACRAQQCTLALVMVYVLNGSDEDADEALCCAVLCCAVLPAYCASDRPLKGMDELLRDYHNKHGRRGIDAGGLILREKGMLQEQEQSCICLHIA
jgi:hypothetical protein